MGQVALGGNEVSTVTPLRRVAERIDDYNQTDPTQLRFGADFIAAKVVTFAKAVCAVIFIKEQGSGLAIFQDG